MSGPIEATTNRVKLKRMPPKRLNGFIPNLTALPRAKPLLTILLSIILVILLEITVFSSVISKPILVMLVAGLTITGAFLLILLFNSPLQSRLSIPYRKVFGFSHFFTQQVSFFSGRQNLIALIRISLIVTLMILLYLSPLSNMVRWPLALIGFASTLPDLRWAILYAGNRNSSRQTLNSANTIIVIGICSVGAIFLSGNLLSQEKFSYPLSRISNGQISVEARENSPSTHFLSRNDNLLLFNENHIWVNYNGQNKRLVGAGGWFQEGDSKEIITTEEADAFTLRVTRTNPIKDPSSISYVLTVPKLGDGLTLYVSLKAAFPEFIKEVEYTVHHAKKYDLFSPKGILNDWTTRGEMLAFGEIPPIIHDHQLLIDPSSDFALRFELAAINKLRNLFEGRTSSFFTTQRIQVGNEHRFAPLQIAVQPKSDLPPSNRPSNWTVIPIMDGKSFALHYQSEHIGDISLGANELRYDGTIKNSFSSEAFTGAWFSDEINERSLSLSETNGAHHLNSLLYKSTTPVRSIGISLSLPKDKDYLKSAISAQVEELAKLGEAGYTFRAHGNYDVYLPNGRFLRNDNVSEFIRMELKDNFEVLFDGKSAIIITSSGLKTITNSFASQIFKTFVEGNLNGEFPPTYFIFVPQVTIGFQDSALVMETDDYQGTIANFIGSLIDET